MLSTHEPRSAEGFPKMLPHYARGRPDVCPCPLHTHQGQARVTVIGGRDTGRAGPTPQAGLTVVAQPVLSGNTSPLSRGISPAPEPDLDKEATRQPMEPADELLTPAQVAQLFGVGPKTVTRWADSGRLRFIRTPGGHRRFRRSEITALLTDRGHHAR